MAYTGRAVNPLWGDTVLAGEAMANMNRIVKLSTAADKTILLATASTDQPCGVMPDGATYASGDDAKVKVLGREKVKLGDTVTRGDRIVAGAAGVGVPCPATGAHGVVGFALQSGVVDDVIEFLCLPHYFNAEAGALASVLEAVDPDLFLSANKNFKGKTGTGEVDLSLMTGTFKTPTGDHTINGQFTLADAINIILNTTTGSKIGTAANQKLALWGATPVIQQVHVADPTACAAMIHTAGTGADGTTPSGAEYNKARADLNALKTAVDDLKTAVDAINAKDAAIGITASA